MTEKEKNSYQKKFGYINYKNLEFLSRYLTPGGRIKPARMVRSPSHKERQARSKIQRYAKNSISIARILCLLPHTSK